MDFENNQVPLSLIDSKDQTFRITTESNIDDMLDSIKKVGLINPPILIKKKSTYTIVCGFRRIKAYRMLGLLNIEAKILGSNANELDCLKFAITDNSFQRPLNLIEQSRALFMLSGFFKDMTSLADSASSLGLPRNPSLIKKIITIYHLPSSIQNGIRSNMISLSMAVELGRCEKDAGITFANIFNDLKLGLNKQRELITLINEISLREDIPVMKVIQESDFQEILQNDELDRTKKTERLRFYLKKRRYPSITRAEQKFEELITTLKLGNNMKLIPPKNFEGHTFLIKLYFNNLKDLQDHADTLKKIIQNPAIMKKFVRKNIL
jgi:ParB family chromosome partitioning protein